MSFIRECYFIVGPYFIQTNSIVLLLLLESTNSVVVLYSIFYKRDIGFGFKQFYGMKISVSECISEVPHCYMSYLSVLYGLRKVRRFF